MKTDEQVQDLQAAALHLRQAAILLNVAEETLTAGHCGNIASRIMDVIRLATYKQTMGYTK